MPKAPVGDLVTSTAGHAKALYGLVLGLVALSGAFYLPKWWLASENKHWEFLVIFPLCVAPTPLAIGIGVHLWSWMERRGFAEMRKGMYYVHWEYSPDRWADYCRSELQNYRWLTLGFVAGGMLVALVMALLMHLDANDLWWAAPSLHYSTSLLGGGAIGLFGTWFVRRRIDQTERLRRKHTAQCLLGPNGGYITGQFWPWSAVAQKCIGVRLEGDKRMTLVATFRVSTQGGAHHKDVEFPVPRDRRNEATVFVDMARRGEITMVME